MPQQVRRLAQHVMDIEGRAADGLFAGKHQQLPVDLRAS
jgi:hypothetical protein